MIVFGASVSAQNGPGGYVHHLRTLLKDENVQVFGYGGYQMEFAHLLTNEFINLPHDLVIVEWFTPVKAYSFKEIELYLGSVLFNLKGKKVLCLMLPNKTAPHFANYHCNLIVYFSKNKIPYLNLTQIHLDNEDIKADGVHTLEKGAKKYAEAIYKHLEENSNLSLPQIEPTVLSNNVLYYAKRYDIRIGQTLEISTDEPTEIYGIEMEIGPFSGYVNVNGRNHFLWDKWCGRSRKTIKLGKLTTPLIIKPVDIKFDRSSSILQPLWLPSEFKMTAIYLPVGFDVQYSQHQ